MSVDLWRRAREIFDAVVELPEEARSAALEEAARSLHIPGPAVEQSPLVAAGALVMFLLISGALVFGYGLSLQRAVETQNTSPPVVVSSKVWSQRRP